jgi:hypothetical protein
MSDTQLMILLRHGPVQANADYVAGLPDKVVSRWARWAGPHAWGPGLDPGPELNGALESCLRDRWHREKITELLVQYYSNYE